MVMQVSWIDADRMKALVAQIAPLDTYPKETLSAVDLDTTPEPMQGTDPESWGFAMDWVEPAETAAPAPVAIKEPPPVAIKEPAPAQIVAVRPELPVQPEFPAEPENEGEINGHEEPLHQSAAALPLSRIRDKLRAIRQRASAAGILTRGSEAAPPPKLVVPQAPLSELRRDAVANVAANGAAAKRVADSPQMPVFDVPTGPRDLRLAAFASWAKQVLPEDGGHVLVMSDDGEVLWGGEAKAGLVLSTMMAWGAAIRASAMSACDEMPKVVHQPLASGNVLTVIPCQTAGGIVHAAVAAPVGLTHEVAQRIREALGAAMK
jgi:hypothetical protein